MQKAALHRLQSLAVSDDNLDELLKGQAASKVVRMLEQSNADSGACLQAPKKPQVNCSVPVVWCRADVLVLGPPVSLLFHQTHQSGIKAQICMASVGLASHVARRLGMLLQKSASALQSVSALLQRTCNAWKVLCLMCSSNL